MVDARSFNFGCSMPDARWSSDARCPMHGELRMPDGRCTRNFSFPLNQRKPKRFEQTSFLGKQKTSLCGKDQHFKVKRLMVFQKKQKKATFTKKNSRLSSAFFLYWTIIRVTILWKSLKQATISIRQYFGEVLIFAHKKIIRMVGTIKFFET